MVVTNSQFQHAQTQNLLIGHKGKEIIPPGELGTHSNALEMAWFLLFNMTSIDVACLRCVKTAETPLNPKRASYNTVLSHSCNCVETLALYTFNGN